MSDGSLSQDEIDALLQGTGAMDLDSGPSSPALTEQQRGAFEQLLQTTVAGQESNLSLLVNNDVRVAAPVADLVDADGFTALLSPEVVQITLDLTEGAPGHHSYVLSDEAAIEIAGPMMGQEGVELDDAAVNALQEAFSQIAGPVVTALGDRAATTVMTDPPGGAHGPASDVSLPDGQFVRLTYAVTIAGRPSFSVFEAFDASVVRAVLRDGQTGLRAPAGAPAQNQAAPERSGGGAMTGMQLGGAPNVQSVQFPNLNPTGANAEPGNIGLLMDVYMEMTVELGRTKKLIKEILGMGEGTIIALDKLAGEPVDILVNHKLIAKGEVVVIDENFGVRVTEIVSPMERMSGMP